MLPSPILSLQMVEDKKHESAQIDLTNESDRGCVLVASALLEEGLEKRFRSIFDSKKIPRSVQDSLFVSNGPLATFSGKIKLAYAIGLIIKETFNDLEAVRKLRNEAAHTARDFDFSDQEIGRKIDSLQCASPYKGKMTRLSFASAGSVEPSGAELKHGRHRTHSEARARLAGYLKYYKALFALGIQNLLMEVGSGLSITEVEALVARHKETLKKNQTNRSRMGSDNV